MQVLTNQRSLIIEYISDIDGNGIDEVLAMFKHPELTTDPDDWDAFIGFIETWLLSSGDTGYDDSYDYVNDDTINLRDFAYWASVWDIPSNKESNWYYLRDALGSVRGLIGGRFNREEDREFCNFDVYGELSIQDGKESTSGNPFLFGSYWYDAEIGLYHTPFRTYDPETGRWLQFDPIGTFDSMNLYEYVRSNPVMYIDPLGLAATLSGKIEGLLGLRAARGIGVMNIYNRFRKNYTLEDELNEMNQVFGGDIQRYYVDVLIHNRNILNDDKWRKISFPPPSPLFREWGPGVPAVAELPGLGFWLNGPHSVSANGCFEAKCCGTKCWIRNRDVAFQWYDQIDANSFKELKNKPAGKFEKFLEGGIGDILGDKLLGMSFYITIHWKDTDRSEIRVNTEPRLKRILEGN